jgi:hypothetical protein
MGISPSGGGFEIIPYGVGANGEVHETNEDGRLTNASLFAKRRN